MELDYRGLEYPEPLKRIREVMENNCISCEPVRVRVDTDQSARLKTFIRMTCFEVDVRPQGDHCLVEFRGDT